jgi:SOS-response transcriptional repressor LexA
VAERNTTPANGEMALVKIDGPAGTEYMIKLFYDTSEGFILRSLNPEFKPITYDEKHVLSAERIVYVIPK